MNDVKIGTKVVTYSDVLAYLSATDRASRRDINRHILALGDAEEREARAEFKYGDKVKFTARKRRFGGSRTLTGTVVKRNSKTIEVRVDEGFGARVWRVMPSLLSKVEA